jgi:hypothetical protein
MALAAAALLAHEWLSRAAEGCDQHADSHYRTFCPGWATVPCRPADQDKISVASGLRAASVVGPTLIKVDRSVDGAAQKQADPDSGERDCGGGQDKQ